MNQPAPELLPCAHCGGIAEEVGTQDTDWVTCTVCEISTGNFEAGNLEPRRVWNTRAAQPPNPDWAQLMVFLENQLKLWGPNDGDYGRGCVSAFYSVQSYLEKRIEAARAHLASQKSEGDGWKLVPIEPTQHMIEIGVRALSNYIKSLPPEERTKKWPNAKNAKGFIVLDKEKFTCRWKAMVDAAPIYGLSYIDDEPHTASMKGQ